MKNPWMSMYLSAANRIANTARGHATAAVKREAREKYAAVDASVVRFLAASRRQATAQPQGQIGPWQQANWCSASQQ